MRLFLTGASGFTGYYFKYAAEKSGYEVIASLSDLTNKKAIYQEVEKIEPDIVVHLAAISFIGHLDDSAFYNVNVIGSTYLLQALTALKKTPKKVLLASSANVYGNCGVSPIKEEGAFSPTNHYAMSKFAMEKMALNYLDRLPIIVTRPFNYTGPRQGPHFLIPKLVRHFANKASDIELGNIDVEREFNDVRMVCEVYRILLDKGVAGEAYNVCSGRAYSLKHVMAVLSEITNHEMKININPALVRMNEVLRLCGSTQKLNATIGEIPLFDLKQTLLWMLKQQ